MVVLGCGQKENEGKLSATGMAVNNVDREKKVDAIYSEYFRCSLELQKEIFLINEPLKAGVRLKNISDKKLEFPDLWVLLNENVIITDRSGKKIPYSKKRPEWVQKVLHHDPITWSPGKEKYAGQLDIIDAYPINQPGNYKLKVRYPLDISVTKYVESNETEIRILPEGSLDVCLKILNNRKDVAKESKLPIEIELTNKLAPSEKTSNISLSFKAFRKDIPKHIWGVPKKIDNKNDTVNWIDIDKFKRKMVYDLTTVLWEESPSSIWPYKSLWGFINPGDKWIFEVIISGKLNEKRFNVVSNQVEIYIKNEKP